MARGMQGAGIVLLLSAILLQSPGCDYDRMKDQESIRTYEEEMPPGVEGTVPVNGGTEVLKTSDPDGLRNPLDSTANVVEQGKTAYGRFCIMCHGPQLDGNGTVGQSFSPLPTDLRSPQVLGQSDGQLFSKISLGYQRHPPLADTVSEADRWAIIRYIRAGDVGLKRAQHSLSQKSPRREIPPHPPFAKGGT